jgi:hypothetical protein
VLRLRALASIAAALVLAAVAAAAAPGPPAAEWMAEQVQILAGPDMEGRGSGTPGAARAAAHISRVFQEAGLRPGGDRGSFLQAFPLDAGRRDEAANVVGILPGTDPTLRHEAIVIGAHYDHLGRGEHGALSAESRGAIHHGADDNASGTVAVLALARAFGAAGGAPRTLIFVAFSGEELGLLGSAHYVARPAWPLERSVLMLNLDMVGRLREERLHVNGVDSARDLRDRVIEAGRGLPLKLELRGDPWGPSDHSTFYAAGQPVLFLFTGMHADYHRPTDTAEKIDVPGLAAVTALAARLISSVAAAPVPPQYVKLDPPDKGVFFGIVADHGEAADRPGVQVGAVRPGSPADRSGVRSGDVIVRFAGVAVKTLDDVRAVLRVRRAGDRVGVVVVRAGREQFVEATLVNRH